MKIINVDEARGRIFVKARTESGAAKVDNFINMAGCVDCMAQQTYSERPFLQETRLTGESADGIYFCAALIAVSQHNHKSGEIDTESNSVPVEKIEPNCI